VLLLVCNGNEGGKISKEAVKIGNYEGQEITDNKGEVLAGKSG
jgi:hypothetical protein